MVRVVMVVAAAARRPQHGRAPGSNYRPGTSPAGGAAVGRVYENLLMSDQDTIWALYFRTNWPAGFRASRHRDALLPTNMALGVLLALHASSVNP